MAVDARFRDMASFSSLIPWDMDFRQLESGPLDARLVGLMSKDCQLLTVQFNRTLHQQGAAPKGAFTFGVPLPETREFRWGSGSARGGSLISFNLENNFHGLTPAYSGVAVSIGQDVLQAEAENLGIGDRLEKILRSGDHWSSSRSVALSRRMKRLAGDLQSGQPPLGYWASFIQSELPREIVRVLAEKKGVGKLTRPEYKHRVLRKALSLVNESNEVPIRVSDLCKRVGCSQATLRRAFLSEFGVTPKSYLRSHCLSAVRDALSQAEPGEYVSDIANAWGFWHMGQFARDYRRQFGELPSVTLSKGRD